MIPSMNKMTALIALVLIGGCKKTATDNAITIQLAPVEKRNIVVSAQANGAIEPVNVVEVKSKASGVVTRMPVDIGSVVKRGDLLVQIDARDVQNQYNQAAAILNSARVSEQIAAAQLKRSRELFNQRIITAQENEAATLTYANANSAVVGARTNLDLAKQRLEDATVRAPISGTIIAKTASLGSVITSATSSASGGTTILNMADLTKVRMRAMVNETDIGNIHPGQVATVTVDAYPGRNFKGTVEKIEPQAVVQSSVTMFAVLITLTNMDAALMPGMNGEATMIVSQRMNVLAVPNDAIRSTKDLATVAPLLGLNADSIKAITQRNRAAGRGGATGAPGTGAAGAAGNGAGGGGVAGRDTSQAARAARRAEFAKAGGGGAGAGPGTRAVVFTKVAGNWVPKSIRTGVSDFDYTEVLNGLQEGDSIALLASVTMQANRQAQVQRARAATGGGLQTTTPAAGGGGGGGGRGPGGR